MLDFTHPLEFVCSHEIVYIAGKIKLLVYLSVEIRLHTFYKLIKMIFYKSALFKDLIMIAI